MMRGRRPTTNGAGFDVSVPEATRTGNSVPGGPSRAGTVTLSEVGEESSTVAAVVPNCTLAPALHPAPASTTSSPGIATEGAMPWMRGASKTPTVAGLDSRPSTTTTTGTGVSRPGAAGISGISTWRRVGEAWTTRPGLPPNRTTFACGVSAKCAPVIVTLCPSPTRAGVIDSIAGVRSTASGRRRRPRPRAGPRRRPAMSAIGG